MAATSGCSLVVLRLRSTNSFVIHRRLNLISSLCADRTHQVLQKQMKAMILLVAHFGEENQSFPWGQQGRAQSGDCS